MNGRSNHLARSLGDENGTHYGYEPLTGARSSLRTPEKNQEKPLATSQPIIWIAKPAPVIATPKVSFFSAGRWKTSHKWWEKKREGDPKV